MRERKNNGLDNSHLGAKKLMCTCHSMVAQGSSSSSLTTTLSQRFLGPPILHSLNTKATYLKFDMLQRHKYIYPTHLCDNITWYQCQYTSSLLTLSLTELFLAGLISTLQWQDHCDSNGTSLICPEIHQRWFRQKIVFLLLQLILALLL